MSLGDLSGLASGVDASSIVDQLISIERHSNGGFGPRMSNSLASRDRRAIGKLEDCRRIGPAALSASASVHANH